MNERVKQARTDALVAEYLYSTKLRKIEILAGTINFLTIIVPILVLAALLISKGTTYENPVNLAAIIVSSILLSLSILSLILRIEQKKESCLVGRR